MANPPESDKLGKQIDDNIRRVYSEVAKEPVPDRFSQLLEQLRQQETANSTPEVKDDNT